MPLVSLLLKSKALPNLQTNDTPDGAAENEMDHRLERSSDLDLTTEKYIASDDECWTGSSGV